MSVITFILKFVVVIISCVVIVHSVYLIFGENAAYGTAIFLAMYVVPAIFENHL